jgi:hypothetical protein
VGDQAPELVVDLVERGGVEPVDRAQTLKGTLPLARLIVSDLHLVVSAVMVADSIKLYPEDQAEDAASAFERYDLVSAPVIDATITARTATRHRVCRPWRNCSISQAEALANTLVGRILITTSPGGRMLVPTSVQPPARPLSTHARCGVPDRSYAQNFRIRA